MAKSTTSPIRVMMIANILLTVAVIAILIFWSQKNSGDKIGRFIPKSSSDPYAKEPVQLETTV